MAVYHLADMGTSLETTPPARLDLRIGGNLLARNRAMNFAGQVIPLLVGVVAMAYVIRRLGPDRFGLLSLAWVVVGYFCPIVLRYWTSTTKFVAELLGKGEIERQPALVWTALTTQTVFGCVAGALFAVASPALADRLLKIPPPLRTEAHWVFLILATSLSIGFATDTFQRVLAASQRFDSVNAVGIPTVALYYVIPAGVLALGLDLRSIVFPLVIGRLVALGAISFSACASIRFFEAPLSSTARFFALFSASAAGSVYRVRLSQYWLPSIGSSWVPLYRLRRSASTPHLTCLQPS